MSVTELRALLYNDQDWIRSTSTSIDMQKHFYSTQQAKVEVVFANNSVSIMPRPQTWTLTPQPLTRWHLAIMGGIWYVYKYKYNFVYFELPKGEICHIQKFLDQWCSRQQQLIPLWGMIK